MSAGTNNPFAPLTGAVYSGDGPVTPTLPHPLCHGHLAMRAEAKLNADAIRESLALLRRYL